MSHEAAVPGLRPRGGEAAPGILFAGIGDEAGAPLDRQIAAVSGLGWRLVELRSVDGVALADLTARTFADLLGSLAEAGLGTACVDSRIAGWARPISHGLEDDLTELERLVPRCAALGTRYIRIMSYPNDGWDEADWGKEVIRRIRLLAHRAEESGLVLLHENCSGWAGTRADRMLRLVEEVDSPALRLLFDTGNGGAYHYEAYAVLAELMRQAPELVAHVHVKDVVGRGTAAAYTLPGEGEARVADCLRLILTSGFAGVWSIEPHLHLRPHEGHDALGDDSVDGFVAYGRHLEELVRTQVLPAQDDTAREENVHVGHVGP